MRLRFLAIDPDTNGDECPALHIDEETGDLVFVGDLVTDPGDLAQLDATSGIGPTESVVRIPARMRAVILEALHDNAGTAVR